MTRLIVNADDFGLTTGVNRAIAELHRAGLVTSATLMARGGAADEAIELALAMPSLGVGCHVVLADGEPVLSAMREIPHLADPVTGRFHSSLIGFLHWLYFQHGWPFQGAATREIEAEAGAQIARIQERGLRLTHVDTHKHLHMFPAVLRPVLRAARAHGIGAVRNPFEPEWSVAATPNAPWLRRAQVRLLRRMEAAFYWIVAEEGFTTTNGSLGMLATGTLDAATLASLLGRIPEGCFELVTHPGYADAELAQANTRLLASREVERKALETLRQFTGIEFCTFAELAASAP